MTNEPPFRSVVAGQQQGTPHSQTHTAVLMAQAQATLPSDLFAVFDGALYDDLRFLLKIHGLRGRPLFLEAGDEDAVASGPFLVPLGSAEQIAGVITLVGVGRTPVIWSWPNGEQELFRHLRTINVVRIPAEQDDHLADDAEVDALEKAPAEPVVFRHWDPEVLAALLPTLLPEQMARLCGAANGLAYFSGHAAAPTVVAHNPVVMPSPQGQLGFTVLQMEMLSANRMTASRRAIASYLRETVPEDVNDLDESALYAIIVEAEVSGNLIGLQSEHAHGLWAFLHVVTGGVSSRSPDIRQHFYKAADDPELVLRQLLDEVRAQAG